MMEKHYSAERSVQIVISLLKQYAVQQVIISPGTTNITLVGSLMSDPWFKLYSSVDERSAAYMACGMAAESGRPVAISCTGATASRNYLPGMTEAFHSKLPVLAITSGPDFDKTGNLTPQAVDRSQIQKDAAVVSVRIPATDADNERTNIDKINTALIALTKDGGGPAHIDLVTKYSPDFSVTELPEVRKIEYCDCLMDLPKIPDGSKVAIFVGRHKPFTEEETRAIDDFCAAHDAVVLTDPASNFKGTYGVNVGLVLHQNKTNPLAGMDLLIHIGEISGAYVSIRPKQVWRVSEDGRIKNHFGPLTAVIKMSDIEFFNAMKGDAKVKKNGYLNAFDAEIEDIKAKMPMDIPFSNAWIAQQTAPRLPEGSRLHLGILNSLRTWSMADIPASVYVQCNTGGFGIDGALSTLLGASLASPDRLFFLTLGDLAFFYDMNAIGNRFVGKNLRILMVNNGKGTEFRNYWHPGNAFGEDADKFIAAGGHFGNKSHELVKHYAKDLGFEYLSASDKEEYMVNLDKFVDPKIGDHPIMFEVFTNNVDESDAIKAMYTIQTDVKSAARDFAKSVLGEKGIGLARKIMKR